MKLLTLLSALTSVSALAARDTPAPWSNYVKNGVFYPLRNATSWRTVYGRSLQLADKSILISWEDYDPRVTQTYWPIYRSTDGGSSFTELSRVQDQVNGWGNWYQPFLYTLPQDIGTFKKGTILLAGTSTPRDLSQAYIDIYASTDAGKTWKFVSHVVYGPGPETIRNGDKAVWEPFLMIYNNQLVCYYSTQVDPDHGQKLSHKTTTNLLNWSAEVDDVAQPNYGDRPGMTTVAYSPKSGKYVMTFEYCGSSFAGGCPVHYKVASNPLEFQKVQPAPILPNDPSGNPNGSPYVIWTDADPAGQGVFIMNGNSREEVFVNTNAVDPNGWKPVNINHWSAYSRGLEIVTTPSNVKKLFVINGGNIGCEGSCYNYVVDALVDVPGYPGAVAASSSASTRTSSAATSSVSTVTSVAATTVTRTATASCTTPPTSKPTVTVTSVPTVTVTVQPTACPASRGL